MVVQTDDENAASSLKRQARRGDVQPPTGWFQVLWKDPRKLWLRRAIFQVHLWSGIAIGLLATVVGITGSAAVYKSALDKTLTPRLYRFVAGQRQQSTDQLIRSARALHPGWSIQYISIGEAEKASGPEPWIFYMAPGGKNAAKPTFAYFDPGTGRFLGEIGQTSGLMNWLAEMHVDLLAGENGRVVNGIGGLLLLLLCLTGISLWWPGRRRIRESLKIRWHARWPRLNWDLHTVFGFWIVVPLAIEALTGAYYCFFTPAAIALVFLLGGNVQQWKKMVIMPPSTVTADATDTAREPLVQKSLAMHPDCVLHGLNIPKVATDPFIVQLNPPRADDRGQYVQVTFDRYSGRVLSDIDSRQQSWAIRTVFFMRPLHFGTFAGQWSRIAWVLVGLSPGFLFFTGFLMWWRRVPGRRLKALSAHKLS